MPRLFYQLTVQSDGLVRAELSGNGAPARRNSRLDLSQLPHIQPFLDDLDNPQSAQTRVKLTALGGYLYHLLFTGAVRAHFEEVVWPLLSPPHQSSNRLTLTLTFQENSPYFNVRHAAALPWEFIYCPLQGGTFLATDPRLNWTRQTDEYPPGTDVLHDITSLRVLLVHLQPEDVTPVSLTRIRNVLQELSEAATAVRRLVPLIKQNPTPAQLVNDLAAMQPHILHLLLHGRFAPDSTRFAFTDSQGQARWYGDHSLTDLFAQHQPRLVIVQACEGGRLADARSLSHGAARLLAAGVPAVVAMQYPITNQVGWEFAETLYRQLGGGAAVDTAVQAARRHLAQYDVSLPDDHASRNFGAVVFWQHPIPIMQERKRMTQTVILIAPNGQRYESDVVPDTLIGEMVRAFVAHLLPLPAYSTRHSLHLGGVDQPPLDTAVTLAEAEISDGAELWLVAERLTPEEPVGLTIEDDEGARFATAVRLNTPVSELANAFLARRRTPIEGQPVVMLVSEMAETKTERPLSPETTLYQAGISHDALLRIKTEALSNRGGTL